MKKLRIIYNSPVVLSFALLSLAVLGLDYLTGGASTRSCFCVYKSSLLDPLFYVRLFGHVLGHSGWTHYCGNMLLFLLTGPMLEEKYGWKRLLLVIASVALVTGIAHILFFNTALLGASGIVFAFIILSSFTGAEGEGIPITLIVVAAIYIGQEVVNGIAQSDNISQIGHIVGGVVGGAYGYLFRSKKRLKRRGDTREVNYAQQQRKQDVQTHKAFKAHSDRRRYTALQGGAGSDGQADGAG